MKPSLLLWSSLFAVIPWMMPDQARAAERFDFLYQFGDFCD
jgi:hypothetical protein